MKLNSDTLLSFGVFGLGLGAIGYAVGIHSRMKNWIPALTKLPMTPRSRFRLSSLSRRSRKQSIVNPIPLFGGLRTSW